jgi:predicted nucleic acid-binding protein
LAAQASLFITGDQALLDRSAVQGLRLVSPRVVYERMQSIVE